MPESKVLHRPNHFPDHKAELLLPGPAGNLECLSDAPEPAEERMASVVLCHPHPQHGGTMHNKVVTIMERSMRELGLRTVRFNYRGVGASEGVYDDGYGETDDLFAVIEWVRQTRPQDQLWLAGFSFGCSVSLRAAQNLKLGLLISIAPAVNYPMFRELERPDCPWLVVQGDEDDVVNPEDVREWVQLQQPPPTFVMMERAGHFFHRRLMDLRGLLKNGVTDALPPVNPKTS